MKCQKRYDIIYKKESICITVGIIVFEILTLTVPFFTVDMILALVLGVSLTILLHLSYKYKEVWLFDKITRPDKFIHDKDAGVGKAFKYYVAMNYDKL